MWDPVTNNQKPADKIMFSGLFCPLFNIGGLQAETMYYKTSLSVPKVM